MRVLAVVLLTACAAVATPIVQTEEDTVAVPRAEAIRVYFEIESYKEALREAERHEAQLLRDMKILRERKDCA